MTWFVCSGAGELTGNTWRDHLVLDHEYCEREVELLLKGSPSQAHRSWFTSSWLDLAGSVESANLSRSVVL